MIKNQNVLICSVSRNVYKNVTSDLNLKKTKKNYAYHFSAYISMNVEHTADLFMKNIFKTKIEICRESR